ncbi:MAG TPA: hypothetical protein VLR47_12165, partial [Rhodospirillales bacterium]|nr:hypothetical protein [Rhodospirillales bacterium]
MGTYKGTGTAETITPAFVSSSVSREPAESLPSAAADSIDGGGRGDVLSGGGGNDLIYDQPAYRSPSPGSSLSVAVTANDGNVVHGDAGNDDITVEVGDTDGANPVGNIAYGDGGDDSVLFRLSARNYPDSLWESAPTGTVTLYGGAGNDLTSVRGYYVGLSPGMTVYQHGGAGNDELLATADEFDPDSSVRGSNNNDYLYGDTGNDNYRVMEAKDTVVERAGEGADTVFAWEMDYVLPAYVENLEMTGGYYPEGRHATGNGLNNLIRIDRWWDGDYTIDGMAG